MKLPWQPCTAGVTLALPYMVMMLLLLHASGLLWWSYSATFMCYEYSQCMHHSFGNCMFVSAMGWNSGYNHGSVFMPDMRWRSCYIHVLLAGFRHVLLDEQYSCVAILAWKYSCLIGTLSRQPKSMETLAI